MALRITPAQARQLLCKPVAKGGRKCKPMGQEKHVLKAVLDYLKAEGVWAMRVNSGGLMAGKYRVRFAPEGTADVLAVIPRHRYYNCPQCFGHDAMLLWIECKSADGKWTKAQREFQERMERDGALYCLARSVEDVKAVLPPKQAKGAAA